MIEDAEIAAAFGVDEADVTDAMRDLVARALAWVERRTNRYFREVREFVAYFRGGGSDTLWLDEIPIIDESDNGLAVAQWSGTEWEEVDPSYFDLWPSETPNGRSRLVWVAGGCWPKWEACAKCPPRNLRVTFNAGYEVGGLPPDIEQLVLDVAVGRFRTGAREAEGLKKEAVDGYSYEAFGDGNGGVTGLTSEQKDTLSDWRHPVLA